MQAKSQADATPTVYTTASQGRPSPRALKTFAQFCRDNPAFTEGGLRWLKFCASPGRKNSAGAAIPVNGFAPAFVNVGRRVYIDEAKFFEIIDRQGGQEAA